MYFIFSIETIKMFKNFLILFLKSVFGLIDLIFFSNKKDIIFYGFLGIPSGNNLALYNYLKEHKLINCDLYWTGQLDKCYEIEPVNSRATPAQDSSLFTHLNYLFFLMKFKVIIVESAGDLSLYIRFLSNHKRIKLLLIHGFSLKSGGILTPNINKEQIRIWSEVGKKFNLISVSSKFEQYIVSSSINAPIENCIIMGPQRPMGKKSSNENERSIARKLLQDTYEVDINDNIQIIFYAPTHRDHAKELKRPILFGYDNLSQLNEDLIKSKTFLFIREHGRSHEDKNKNLTNIIYTSKFAYIDFHNLYAGIDGLISDYSGIFLEYLISHIKIGFWQYDLSEYRQDRGFSITEDIFKTGNKITNPNDFIIFVNQVSYSKEKQILRECWHHSLYENSSKQSLLITVDEIKRRANFTS